MRLASSTLENLIILAENCDKVKSLAAKYDIKIGTSSSTPDIRNLVVVDVTSDADVDSNDSADELGRSSPNLSKTICVPCNNRSCGKRADEIFSNSSALGKSLGVWDADAFVYAMICE